MKRTSLQPICSLNEMTQLWILNKKKFFSKSWAFKLRVRLICECGLYAGVDGKLSQVHQLCSPNKVYWLIYWLIGVLFAVGLSWTPQRKPHAVFTQHCDYQKIWDNKSYMVVPSQTRNDSSTASVLPSLTGRRYSDRRFIKWARFCRDGQLA